MSINYLRQQDLIDQDKIRRKPITVIGAGAVGSFTTLALAKMGARDMTVYDHDRIEDHNLASQFYPLDELGSYKVESLSKTVKLYTGAEVKGFAEMYEDQNLRGIVVVCVDSMEARRKIWQKVKNNLSVELLIDTRMGAEVALVYALSPIEDHGMYRSSLYLDPVQEPCTRRSICYTALGLSALACGKVKKYLENEPFKKVISMDYKLGHYMSLQV